MFAARIQSDEAYIPQSRPRRSDAPRGPASVDRISADASGVVAVPSPAQQLQAQLAAGLAMPAGAVDDRYAPRTSFAIIAGISLALWGGIGLAVASLI